MPEAIAQKKFACSACDAAAECPFCGTTWSAQMKPSPNSQGNACQRNFSEGISFGFIPLTIIPLTRSDA
ncbi:MAG TPA: hypothetical protein VFZ59_22825 [Verrucomicrobiae bacterium]|nr:hypothetical protein [Verrucomicrobiae bacterium]